jgi:hypothetical protein
MRLGPVVYLYSLYIEWISYIFNGVLEADHSVKHRIRGARV